MSVKIRIVYNINFVLHIYPKVVFKALGQSVGNGCSHRAIQEAHTGKHICPGVQGLSRQHSETQAVNKQTYVL